jgi:hypothetical protein
MATLWTLESASDFTFGALCTLPNFSGPKVYLTPILSLKNTSRPSCFSIPYAVAVFPYKIPSSYHWRNECLWYQIFGIGHILQAFLFCKKQFFPGTWCFFGFGHHLPLRFASPPITSLKDHGSRLTQRHGSMTTSLD